MPPHSAGGTRCLSSAQPEPVVNDMTTSAYYSEDWRSWTAPVPPEFFNPTVLLLDRHVSSGLGDKAALIVDGIVYDYARLLTHVARAANGLATAGLIPEARVLLFGTDSLEYLATWLGALRLGAIPVVVSDAYKASSLNYFLEDTGATHLVIDAEQWTKLEEIAADLPPTLKAVIRREDGKTPPVSIICSRPVFQLTALYDAQSPAFPPLERHRNDIAYMFYSGGTTGTAKGIPHLLEDFIQIPARHGAFWEYSADDRVHATSKKYFTHGLWPGVLIPLAVSATAIISRKPPTPENLIALVEGLRPTKLITVPTVVKTVLAHVEATAIRPDFSSLELVATASEKMAPEIFADFHATFGVELFDSIGSAEVTYEWIANRQAEFRRGSLGKPVFGVEIRLIGHDGTVITTPDTVGQAHVRSRTAALFYWRKLDETLATMGGGWVRTGDELYFDQDGFFWFAGRSNDLFKVKGLWVSPIEVEAAITAHPAVLEAAVIPWTGPDGLTKPKAYVVLKPGQQPGNDLSTVIRDNVHRSIGGYKVPDVIEYTATLPRTTLLKIDRRALRDAEEIARS